MICSEEFEARFKSLVNCEIIGELRMNQHQDIGFICSYDAKEAKCQFLATHLSQ